MMKSLILACILGVALARCPNDCNGRGVCNAGSVCECERNWAGTDCSERVCYYGLAFVDSPLGDIDGSDSVGTDIQVHLSYSNAPVGEQYDPHYGLARSTNTDEWDEAHFYRECSNKGTCDRSSGSCECFPGFEGEGCQRLACPNDCNGKGQCVLLGNSDTTYAAWDADKTVGCVCDPGYTGPDCSMRKCPIGVDPIKNVYTDTSSVYKIEWGSYSGALLDGAAHGPNGAVYWTITVTDDYGDVWTTSAVTTYYNAQSSCSVLTATGCSSTPSWYNDGAYDFSDNAAFADQDAVTAAMFDESNIAEQVNASVQALPNDVVRNSYVWVADNSGSDNIVYPSFSTPIADANPSDCQEAACGTYSFASGPSSFVNDAGFRFPFWSTSDDGDVAFDVYSNCADGSLCVFVKVADPTHDSTRVFDIDYKFQTNTDGAGAMSREVTGSTFDSSATLVSISEVGEGRVWRDDVDGTPAIAFDSDQAMDVCSKRGMCDYDSGLCSCFDGYSGYRCSKRSASGNY